MYILEKKESDITIVYLLGRHTLPYNQHLTKTAQEIKSRNNMLAETSWGADGNKLRSAALALTYSTTEYCAPVW